MRRLFTVAVACYVPHLVEEALTGMHDDPLIVAAYAALAPLGPRHAAYLVCQATFALGLVAVLALAHGGRARRAVAGAFGLALLAESHHLARALVSLAYNPGLVTALPLPLIGVLVVRRVASSGERLITCSSRSSSSWASVASSSGSRPSSPPLPRHARSASPPPTTTRPAA